MNVTDVYVHRMQSGKLLGFANIQIDNFMTWNGFRIFASDDGGINVLPPSKDYIDKKTKEKKWSDIIRFDKENPAALEFLQHITDAVSQKYYGAQGKRQEQQRPEPTPPPQENNTPGYLPDDSDIPF